MVPSANSTCPAHPATPAFTFGCRVGGRSVYVCHCFRCHHEWMATEARPRTCSKCKSAYWDSVKAARAKKTGPKIFAAPIPAEVPALPPPPGFDGGKTIQSPFMYSTAPTIEASPESTFRPELPEPEVDFAEESPAEAEEAAARDDEPLQAEPSYRPLGEDEI